MVLTRGNIKRNGGSLSDCELGEQIELTQHDAQDDVIPTSQTKKRRTVTPPSSSSKGIKSSKGSSHVAFHLSPSTDTETDLELDDERDNDDQDGHDCIADCRRQYNQALQSKCEHALSVFEYKQFIEVRGHKHAHIQIAHTHIHFSLVPHIRANMCWQSQYFNGYSSRCPLRRIFGCSVSPLRSI
jgi:hypothetical protein